MPDNKASPWLARVFWIAACGNILLVLIPAVEEWNHPQGEFSGLAVVSLLAVALCLVVCTAVVAAIRRPMAYGFGIALVSVPFMWFASLSVSGFARYLAAPSIEDQDAGRGYFRTPADRALADAIVAQDVAKVASLAPAANLNTVGWGQMTFMRLALENGHANHEILGILLRNHIDPDQDSSILFQLIYNEKDEVLLRLVIDSGVDLNQHMGRGQWYYFVRCDWPEGLTLMLDHGVDPETRDNMGYTPIMRAARSYCWSMVETLLDRGARTDQRGNDGRSLHDLLVAATVEYQRGEVPPRIVALRDSLR
jgi:hypothetical protein